MKIGIAGVHYGHIGGMFRSAISASNGEVIGIFEPDDGLFHKYADEHELTRFDSLEALVDASDMVAEGMRHEEKADLVETCARHGVYTFLDKPLCRSGADYGRIRRAVEASGIKLTMNFTSRSHPPFVALRKAIENGELGELVSLITTHPHKLADTTPDWYFDPSRYAGVFHDLAGHGVDQILWLSGSTPSPPSRDGRVIPAWKWITCRHRSSCQPVRSPRRRRIGSPPRTHPPSATPASSSWAQRGLRICEPTPRTDC